MMTLAGAVATGRFALPASFLTYAVTLGWFAGPWLRALAHGVPVASP